MFCLISLYYVIAIIQDLKRSKIIFYAGKNIKRNLAYFEKWPQIQWICYYPEMSFHPFLNKTWLWSERIATFIV